MRREGREGGGSEEREERRDRGKKEIKREGKVRLRGERKKK